MTATTERPEFTTFAKGETVVAKFAEFSALLVGLAAQAIAHRDGGQ